MNIAQKRVVIYVVQYNGTWGWEPMSAHLCHKSANDELNRARRDYPHSQWKSWRLIRYMPEVKA
jgi:hypothetical protein